RTSQLRGALGGECGVRCAAEQSGAVELFRAEGDSTVTVGADDIVCGESRISVDHQAIDERSAPRHLRKLAECETISEAWQRLRLSEHRELHVQLAPDGIRAPVSERFDVLAELDIRP